MYFLVKALDKENMFELRKKTRESHLEYLNKNLIKVKMAGPLIVNAIPCGSVLIIETESREKLEEWLDNDPYKKIDLFKRVTVEEINISVWNN